MSNYAPERVRFNFRLDLAAALLGATFFAGSFMPVLVRRMGGSEIDVALVMASGPIGHILAPLAAYLYDRFNPAKVLAFIGIMAKLVFVVALAFSTSAPLLALSWVLFNIVALSTISSSTALVRGMYPDEHRATAMARVRMSANIVAIGSVVAGGALLQLRERPTLVLGASALVSLAAPLFLLFLRYDDRGKRMPMPSPLRLGAVALQDTAFRRYLLATTFVGFGNAIGGTTYPVLLVDRFDASTTVIGIMAATQSAALIAGFHFWGSRIDRGSTVAIVGRNALLMLGLPLAYLVAPSAPFLLIGSVIAGWTTACADLAFYTAMIELAGPRAPNYMAAQSFVLGVRATVAPFVGSALLISLGPSATLAAVVACVAIGALLMRRVRPAPRTERLRPAGKAVAEGVKAFAD